MEQLLISNAEYLGLKEQLRNIEAKFEKAAEVFDEATENLEFAQADYDEAELQYGLIEAEKVRLSN